MEKYIKEVQELELDIKIAISDYVSTGDMKYIVKADHLSHQLAEERRVYYGTTRTR